MAGPRGKKTLLQQAMEMKEKMEALKETLGDERVEASSGGGMVKVVFSGKMELLSIDIDPDILKGDDPEMTQTLIQAAVNEGIVNAQEMVKNRMAELTNGMNIPGITS